MESTIVKYLEIQKIDSEAGALIKVIGEIPVKIQKIVDSITGMETELAELKTEIEKTRERISISETDLKKLKELNENNIIRGKKSRNQREYKAFEKDAKTIETKTKETEDKYLSEMATLATLEEKLSELEAAFPDKESELLREKGLLEEEIQKANQAIDQSEMDKGKIYESISPENVIKYKKASEGRPGRALAAVENSTCLACHMNIPPQLYNELHRNDKIMLCPHCHRIMYIRKNPAYGYVPDEEPKAEESKPKRKGRRPKKDLEQDNAAY
ncbi:MAG: C4-type zinc ribbon domain-containing protein [Deltaproteobacteria bacterium]|jgi:predicted  nucleic acid-binding Zn-ribbon protein|nr:C4-type zinc ribbon domain-containing protein [Deltaproteobacteria bacterium]